MRPHAFAVIGLSLFSLAAGAEGQCVHQWSAVANSNPPSARDGSVLEYDTARNVLVLFGGLSGSTFNRDTWEFADGAWTQRSSASAPPAGAFSASCYDRDRHRVVVFGGQPPGGGASSYTGETWEWDGTAWSLRATSGPSRRAATAMVYDTVRHVCVLFGGQGAIAAENTLGDTWEWNGSTWTQRSIPGPQGRYLHAMAYDQLNGEVVMHGGSTSGGSVGDTWTYDGYAWQLRSRSGPGRRHNSAMAYDPQRGVVVLAGGRYPPNNFGDTWTWDGTGWTLAAPFGFSNREHAPIAYSAAAGGLVSFGGIDTGAALRDLSVLPSTLTLTGTYQPRDLVLREGTTAVLAVDAPAGATVAWTRVPSGLANGVSPTGAVRSGVSTPTLTITNPHPGDSGLHFAIVNNSCGRYSASRSLTILCPADYNEDETLDPDDLADYITAYFSLDVTHTDFNHDGVVNSNDLADFISTYFEPCG